MRKRKSMAKTKKNSMAREDTTNVPSVTNTAEMTTTTVEITTTKDVKTRETVTIVQNIAQNIEEAGGMNTRKVTVIRKKINVDIDSNPLFLLFLICKIDKGGEKNRSID